VSKMEFLRPLEQLGGPFLQTRIRLCLIACPPTLDHSIVTTGVSLGKLGLDPHSLPCLGACVDAFVGRYSLLPRPLWQAIGAQESKVSGHDLDAIAYRICHARG